MQRVFAATIDIIMKKHLQASVDDTDARDLLDNISELKKVDSIQSNDSSRSNSKTNLASREERRKRRLELNRKAAQLSRQRKKLRVQSLEKDVIVLKRENRELRVVNDTLRNLMSNLRYQNQVQAGQTGAGSVEVQQLQNKYMELEQKIQKTSLENKALRMVLSRVTNDKRFMVEKFDDMTDEKINKGNPSTGVNNSSNSLSSDSGSSSRGEEVLQTQNSQTIFFADNAGQNGKKDPKNHISKNLTEGSPNKLNDQSPKEKYLPTYMSFPPPQYNTEEVLEDSFW